MTISSSTPEGQPACCPLCQASIVVQPSLVFGDATCPGCGRHLWILQAEEMVQIYSSENSKSARSRILRFMADYLGINTKKFPIDAQTLQELGVDEVDMMELVMAIEAELDP